MMGSCYPFGLKHKGYNNVVNSTNPALKFKYNGTEYEESLGLNLYEMDVRSYDPTIARWTSIDPVTHHSKSTYNAFDNNPIFWADPSGADSQNDFFHAFMNAEDKEGRTGWEKSGGENFNNDNSTDPPNDFENFFKNKAKEADVLLDQIKQGYPFQQPEEKATPFSSTTAGAFEIAGGFLGFAEHTVFGASHWLGTNGKFYSRSWGGNQYTGPRMGAYHATKLYSFAGKVTFWGSTAMGAYNFALEPSYETGFSFVGNTGVAAYATWGGPIGWFTGVMVGGAQLYYSSSAFQKRIPDLDDHYGSRYWHYDPVTKRAVPPTDPDYASGKKKSARCFVMGTKILMSDFTQKSIENIKVGDYILSVNTNSMSIEKDSVSYVTSHKSKKVVSMILEDNTVVKSTVDHPFWLVNKGWSVFEVETAIKNNLELEVSEIEEGDSVLLYHRGKLKDVKILSIIDNNEYQDVYNIDNVEKNNTFFANKILVHNRAN